MNKVFRNKKRNGFTLVEVLVAMTIFSMVVVMSATTFTSSSNVNRKISGSSLIQEKISVFLDQMLSEIRQAEYAYFETDSSKNKLTIIMPDPNLPDNDITKIYQVNKSGGNIIGITVQKNTDTPQSVDMNGVNIKEFNFSGNPVSDGSNGSVNNIKTIKSYPFIRVSAIFASSIDKTVPDYEISTIMTLRNFKKDYSE